MTCFIGALSVNIGTKSLNLKTASEILGGCVIGDTLVALSNISIHSNDISDCRVRVYSAATTFGSTANGGGISVFIGSSGFSRIFALALVGSTVFVHSNITLSKNALVQCKSNGKISFGPSSGADVRGGGISFMLGITAIAYVSANWQVGSVSFQQSIIFISGNSFSHCNVFAESDAPAFASSAHGGATSIFIGTLYISVFT